MFSFLLQKDFKMLIPIILDKLQDLQDVYIAEKRIETSTGERWTLEDMKREITKTGSLPNLRS